MNENPTRDILVIRDLAHRVSNWRAQRTLTEEMEEQGLVGIVFVDSALTIRRVNKGFLAMAGGTVMWPALLLV